MSYKIKKLQRDKASELGLTIKPSTNPNKKLDVFIDKKRVASIGANISTIKGKPMMDYATYLKEDKKKAEYRRENYIKRHSKEPKIDNKGRPSKSFYSDEILWGKKKDNINNTKPLQKYKKVVKDKQEKKEKKIKKETTKRPKKK